MSYVKDFFTNYILMCAVVGWLSAQILKTIIDLIQKKKISIFQILFSNGGMPSSHTAAVVALCIACGIKEGLGSSIFAVSALFAMIVMIDASGVRYETGKQSKILNKIAKELFAGNSEEVELGLKELVGHTPFQVIMGALNGVIVAVTMSFAMGVL